jgi:flagellar assembly factor FliW
MISFRNQYNEINVMQFLFNLLRIKGPYMFRALLAQHQEALHKRHLVYCLRIMSVGCGTVAVSLQRPLILNKLNEKCITLVL